MAVKKEVQKKGEPKPVSKPASVKKSAPAGKPVPKGKTIPIKTKRALVGNPSPETLKKTITYFYLLSFCPPEHILDFARRLAPLRKTLAAEAGMKETPYFDLIVPDVCRRIVAFHQASREPEQNQIEGLVNAARQAIDGPQKAKVFQQEMTRISALPPRARLETRLHRRKGCALCQAPCRYGYFSLVSDPPLNLLKNLFQAETKKPAKSQNPLRPVYEFTLGHLVRQAGVLDAEAYAGHLANISFCLLLLGMAKSRLALPEQQLRLFQAANQEFNQRLLTKS